MEKYKITEIVEKEDSKITYIWHPGLIPADIPVQQVYGFCNTKDNLVILVRERGDNRFTPPGGGVENGETALGAFCRELMEEAQFVPEDIKLFGSLEVINPGADEEIQKHNLQVRFVCRIGSLDRFVPLKDGETEQRIFIHYKDLPEYVGYINKYKSGRIQFEMYSDYIEEKIKL